MGASPSTLTRQLNFDREVVDCVGKHVDPLLFERFLSGSNVTARNVYLQWGRMGDPGVRGLSFALKTNFSIRVLDVSSNGIGDSGAFDIARALVTNARLPLEELNMENNLITDRGAAALVCCRMLHCLELSDNTLRSQCL